MIATLIRAIRRGAVVIACVAVLDACSSKTPAPPVPSQVAESATPAAAARAVYLSMIGRACANTLDTSVSSVLATGLFQPNRA